MSSEEQVPVKKVEDVKPVAWTPEDASRFLTSAIQEAQRPLADALKDRPVTSKAFTVILAVICLAALIIGLILSSQIEKADRQVDRANKEKKELADHRDAIRLEKDRLQIMSEALESRLIDARQQHTTLESRLQEQIEAARGGDEELRRIRSDMQRFRRQNELLRSQISGLEMEKVALARQLEAVKAMAIDQAVDGEALEEPLAGDALPEATPPESAAAEPATEFVAETPPASLAPAEDPQIPAAPEPADQEPADGAPETDIRALEPALSDSGDAEAGEPYPATEETETADDETSAETAEAPSAEPVTDTPGSAPGPEAEPTETGPEADSALHAGDEEPVSEFSSSIVENTGAASEEAETDGEEAGETPDNDAKPNGDDGVDADGAPENDGESALIL